jgi:methyl-accepting chemotaxis protein
VCTAAAAHSSFLRRLKVRHKLSLLIVLILAVFVASHAIHVYTLNQFQVGGPVHRQLKLQLETYDTVQALLASIPWLDQVISRPLGGAVAGGALKTRPMASGSDP